MPRSPSDNQQIKDARRTDILRAATRVFAKKGFTDSKISDVAKEAGLSHGLVYHYFANKEAVFTAILEDKVEEAEGHMAEDDARPGSSLERLRATLEHWIERVQNDPETSLVMTQALLSNTLTPETRAMMRNHMRTAYRDACERIAHGQAKGEIGTHAPAPELASTLVCLMRGLAFSKVVDFGPEFTVPTAETLMRLVLPDASLGALAPRVVRPRAARVARGPKTQTISKTKPQTKTVRKASR